MGTLSDNYGCKETLKIRLGNRDKKRNERKLFKGRALRRKVNGEGKMAKCVPFNVMPSGVGMIGRNVLERLALLSETIVGRGGGLLKKKDFLG